MNGGSQRPRVAFVVGYLNSGGAERAALNMAAALTGLDCRIVAEWQGGDLASAPEAADAVYVAGTGAEPTRARRIVGLARTLRRMRPDVVVSMLSPLVTTTAAMAAGARAVHWLQAPWSQTTRVSGRDMTARAQRLVLNWAIRRSAFVAATTPGLIEECCGLGMARDKLALLPNGLVLPGRDWAAPAGRPGPPTIVTVGRLEPPKRHDLTIKAVAQLAARREVRLIIVGSGSAERELRALVAEHQISHLVEFAGFIPDPHEALRRADVFVLATEYEGFGNVIVEALSESLPIVVSDVPHGPRFILDDGHFGTLVPPGSVGDLAAALDEALDTTPMEDNAARSVRERAAMFSLERVAIRFEELMMLAAEGAREVPSGYRMWT